MMNVAVNGRFLSRRITGVERYGREILRQSGDGLRVIPSDRWARGAAGYAWEQLILPGKIHVGEILWSPANLGPLAVRNQVLTLHDLSPLENPVWFKPLFALWYRILIPLLVRRVRHVTVPSTYVQEKVLRYFHINIDCVTVVPGGVDTSRFNPKVSPPCEVPERYVLFVGTVQSRKNLGVLWLAWQEIYQRFPDVWLLIAGGAGGNFRHEALPKNLDRFRWLGYFSDEELPGLYANAEVFVLPSHDEGFGLTLLEAMACGTTVIAANTGAIPDVVGETALLFNSSRVDELALLLDRCLKDTSLRNRMATKGIDRARGFSWENSAMKLWEVFQKCQ